ncbi:MAG TPA: tetratricopeptide repeat protein [Bacteroidales bacterium]|nr:tetratricopeptide repeat protein [Bacteroidales bacterium]
MKQIFLLLTLPAILLLGGCKPGYKKLSGEMRSLERRLYQPGSAGFDKVKADSLMGIYQDFLRHYSGDTMAPAVVFRMANLALNLGKPDTAILLFDRYMKDYPQGPKAEVCLFFKAFIYENNLQDFDKAKKFYEDFLNRYPNSDFANDARIALQNLGKTPDQYFMEFEAKRKADSTRVADSLAGLAVKKSKKK